MRGVGKDTEQKSEDKAEKKLSVFIRLKGFHRFFWSWNKLIGLCIPTNIAVSGSV